MKSVLYAFFLIPVALFAGKPAPFSVSVGTQTIDPKYQFTDEPVLLETARGILEMGSDTLKFTLSDRYASQYRVPANSQIKSCLDLLNLEPSYKEAMDMPFRNIMFWLYPFENEVGAFMKGEQTPEDEEALYQAVYEVTVWILENYSGSGKSFFIGNWEGDWHTTMPFNGYYSFDHDAPPVALEGAKLWFTIREKAIADALAATPHHDVEVYFYIEICHVKKCIEEDRPAIVNRVLPYINCDFVSWSSYDVSRRAGELGGDEGRKMVHEALDYIEAHLPPSDIPGKRVFVGEYGYKHEWVKDPEIQEKYTAEMIQWSLEWGCPFILYWQYYCNELRQDTGKFRGFWLINTEGEKTPTYHLHRKFLEKANAFVADYQAKNDGKLPPQEYFNSKAVDWIELRDDVAPAPPIFGPRPQPKAKLDKPNILFITMDDMNWDSAGCYGSPVEDITPNIDSLAADGMRFQHAFIQSPICTPSRNVLSTGRYPHVSGVTGFYSVEFPSNTVQEYLREAGYFTGVVQKMPDSTPTNDYNRYWDYHKSMGGATGRTPSEYGDAFKAMIEGSQRVGKPFFAQINIVDPHLPFYGGPKFKSDPETVDQTPPSRVYLTDEVPVPGFLHHHSAFAQEMADYYSTVRRGDDTVGLVLDILRGNGLEDDTIIILLSDHGMSMPFAKSHLYPAGVRTPWIMVWPGVAEPGYLDTEHMISAIDFMPTILEIIGTPVPEGLEGRSILPLVKGESQEGRDRVFVQLNENPNADVRPMRAVYTRDFAYIFSPWSDGERVATMEARWYRSWGTMNELSKKSPLFAERFEFLQHRKTEELYAYSIDPDALNDLIDNPSYATIADQLRRELEEWMQRTDDYVLPAFRKREDPAAMSALWDSWQQLASERAKVTEWKRWRNLHGPTGGNRSYFKP